MPLKPTMIRQISQSVALPALRLSYDDIRDPRAITPRTGSHTPLRQTPP